MSDNRQPIYKIGDKVRIINYGHLIWQNKLIMPTPRPKNIYYEDDKLIWFDLSPERIGKEGIISKVSNTQNIPGYSIEGIGAWYREDQMELVN